jgi:enediyne biosynthesis protein E4
VDNDGDLDLYVVSGGNENTAENGMLQDRLYLNNGFGNFTKADIPTVNSSGSVVLPYDFDRDGDFDLFVAGRQVPGHYLKPADSYLLRNQGGVLVDVTDEVAPDLSNLGMVTSAVWTDYDGDGNVDLIVVGEWMQITIFEQKEGKFTKITNLNNGLEHSEGWWWSIVADDFDGDGDPDYVVGNMGFNYKHRAKEDAPLEAFIGDFNNDGLFDLAMGYYQDGSLFPTYDWNYAEMQDPKLSERIPTVNQYAESTLYDIYGEEKLKAAGRFQIKTLSTAYIENLGNGKFEMRPFPNQVQISNTNSIVVKDVDGDGNKDLILAGNLYPMDVRTVRNDAGIGLWMRGDGKGNFLPVAYQQSGLYIPGDVRHVKEITIDGVSMLIAAKNNNFIQLIKIHDPTK